MSNKCFEEFVDLVDALDFVAHLRIQGHRPEWHKLYRRNTYIVLWQVESRREVK